jgi:hypothetical protein
VVKLSWCNSVLPGLTMAGRHPPRRAFGRGPECGSARPACSARRAPALGDTLPAPARPMCLIAAATVNLRTTGVARGSSGHTVGYFQASQGEAV